jgi:hypothetical protein
VVSATDPHGRILGFLDRPIYLQTVHIRLVNISIIVNNEYVQGLAKRPPVFGEGAV